MSGTARRVATFLAGLEGVRSALPLPQGERKRVLTAEERYERSGALPILNLGVRTALERELVVVLLKDRTFRKPPAPTLYLVEEGGAPPGEELRFDDTAYRILGEELIGKGRRPPPGAVAIADDFALYPDRRTDPRRPSCFLLPPVPFPEIQEGAWRQRIAGVVSASPSSLGDVVLRGICAFPEDPALATLLVGFDAVEEG